MQAEIIVITRLVEEKLPSLEEAVLRVFPEDGHLIVRYVQEIIHRAKSYSYIAEGIISRKTLGFVISVLEDRWTGHVLYLGVLPEYRRRRLGTRLLCLSLLDLFRRSDIERVYLEVSTKNEAAVRLYSKLGFSITRLIRRYYSDGSDCYVMTLSRDVYESYTRDICSMSLCLDMDLQALESSLLVSRQQSC